MIFRTIYWYLEDWMNLILMFFEKLFRGLPFFGRGLKELKEKSMMPDRKDDRITQSFSFLYRGFCWGEVIHISVPGRWLCSIDGVSNLSSISLNLSQFINVTMLNVIYVQKCKAEFNCNFLFYQAQHIWTTGSAQGVVWQGCWLSER